MKTKNLVTRILALSLCMILLCLSITSCAGCDKVKSGAGEILDGAVEGAQDIYNSVKDKTTADLDMSFTDGGYIRLTALDNSQTEISGGEGGGTGGTTTTTITKTICATVTPAAAPDKSLTWEVYWITNPFDEDTLVTDYISILPSATTDAGTANCYVICKQPFYDGLVGIRVTTVVGGYTAECQVTYKGVPSYMNFHLVNDDGTDTYIAGTADFKSGSSYSVKMVLGNVFGAAGEDYGSYEVISLSGSGTFLCGSYRSGSDGAVSVGEYTADLSNDGIAYRFFDAIIDENNILVLTMKQAIKEYFFAGSTGYTQYISGGDDCVFYVTVRETLSGLEHTLSFTIDPQVSSVSLDTASLEF